jgi:hypothetical protein
MWLSSYVLTVAEFRRLAAYKAAVQAAFYTDWLSNATEVRRPGLAPPGNPSKIRVACEDSPLAWPE